MSSTSLQRNEDRDIESRETVALEVMPGGAMGAIVRSEVEAQLDAAHKYPRSVKRFLNEATELATYNVEIAASCMYTLPRGKKPISGPSVRLAEICISAWGNLHVGARTIGAEETEVISQGVCWDLEKNVRISIEKRRRITYQNGERFNDDMITVTGNAAASIALRDAAFRVIPRTYVEIVYNAAKKVAVGDASTLVQRRATILDKIVKMGAMMDRILGKLGRAAIDDINLGDLELLIGWGTAIHSGDAKVDEIFPPVVQEHGKVDLNSLKPGTEGNRGHADTNLGQVKQEKTETLEEKRKKAAAQGETKSATSETKSPEPETAGGPDPEAPLTKDQNDKLETIRNQQNIDSKTWRAWILKAFDAKLTSQLRQKHYDRCLAWSYAGGQEDSDGQ